MPSTVLSASIFLRNPVVLFSPEKEHYSTSRKVAGSIPGEIIGFFNSPNPSSRTVTLGLTQPLTEMSTRNLSGDKGRPACKANKLTAICETII
jgi:hypothetical protein